MFQESKSFFGSLQSHQTENSQIEFECQHGADECFGNKVQGCMLSRIPDQDTVTDRMLIEGQPLYAEIFSFSFEPAI